MEEKKSDHFCHVRKNSHPCSILGVNCEDCVGLHTRVTRLSSHTIPTH